MTEHNIPTLPDDLKELFATEAEIDSAAPVFEEALLARVSETLSATGVLGGAIGSATLLAVLVVLATGIGVGAVLVTNNSNEDDQEVLDSKDAPSHLDTRAALDAETTLAAWFGDPGRPSRRIAGRVFRDGMPLPGARVRLVSYATRAGLTEPSDVVTDASGEFDFGERRASDYDISATGTGLGFGHKRITTTNPNEDFDDLRIEVTGCADAFEGRITDASGGAISGATVSLTRGRGNDITSIGMGVTSNDDGHYRLCAESGDRWVMVRAHGYGGLVTQAALVGRTRLDVSLIPESLVRGLVRDIDGNPVVGAKVWLGSTSSFGSQRAAGAVAATDSEGRFRYAGVSPGRHYLWAHTDVADGNAMFSVAPGEETGVIDIVIEQKEQVRVTVVGESGPLPGAFVYVIVDGHRRATMYSDHEGRFEVKRAPLDARLSFWVRGQKVLSPEFVEARGAKDVVLRVEAAAPPATIRGLVSLGGKPVSRAIVSVVGYAHEARTGSDGRYELTDLGDGPVNLDVRAAGAGARLASPQSLTVRSGDVVELNLVLEAAGAIHGMVVDRDGKGLAAMTVEYVAEGGDRCQALTTASGEYACSMLLGQRAYRPSVRPANERGAHLPLVDSSANELLLAVSETRDRRLVVDYGMGVVEGRVVGPDRQGLADVRVRAIPESSGLSPQTAPWLGLPTAITDARGHFRLKVRNAERYAVHSRAASGGEAIAAGVLANAAPVLLVLSETGRITGTIAGFQTRPKLLIRRLGDTVEFFFPTLSGDEFTLDRLSPGTYAVLAASRDQAAGELVTVSGGDAIRLNLAPRPTSRLTVTVTDFLTGSPRKGVQCKLTPYIENAGVFDWGTLAPLTDENGIFAIDAPSGDIEVTCLPRGVRHTGGAARVSLKADASRELRVPVVERIERPAIGDIGSTIEFQHRADDGYVHRLVDLHPNGPARAAGLKAGDAIVFLDGRDVRPLIDDGLTALFASIAPGTSVTLGVERGGQLLERDLVLWTKQK